jgi:hypothetical protein
MAEGCELDLSSLPHLSGMTPSEEKRKWKMKFKKPIYGCNSNRRHFPTKLI